MGQVIENAYCAERVEGWRVATEVALADKTSLASTNLMLNALAVIRQQGFRWISLLPLRLISAVRSLTAKPCSSSDL
jgi:hypothetical protein